MEAPARDGTLRLLPASPPDIIRGVQKDDIYSNQLHDGCQDLAQRVLGVFPALQYEREVRLLAQLLYHGVTTGAGLQTLGEEYCNMMQVTRDGQLLSRQHRSTLVLLQSLVSPCAFMSTEQRPHAFK
uniref:RING-type E3 ubiquitin transferase n=1 Tax=Dunaliella tertiolecta TaxID=3047 RepID=A0A7S3R508_DUNTE